MPADVFVRLTPITEAPGTVPDAAFAARARLLALRDALTRAVKTLGRSRWNEPPVFFFDPRRQAELEAFCTPGSDRFAELTALISTEMPSLLATVEIRRLARAIDGLAAAARSLATHCSAALDLADLLAVPDDEVFLVLVPPTSSGWRFHLRGAADVAQLRSLLTESAFPRIQLYTPAALQSDGTLPLAFSGCEHWLWPTQPLSAVPRIGGERVVLAGPATVQAADGPPRFPSMEVESEVIQTLNVFQTADCLSELCGNRIRLQPSLDIPAVARAA